MKNKITALLLALVLVVSGLILCSCGDDDDNSIGDDLNVELSDDDEGWSPVWKP